MLWWGEIWTSTEKSERSGKETSTNGCRLRLVSSELEADAICEEPREGRRELVLDGSTNGIGDVRQGDSEVLPVEQIDHLAIRLDALVNRVADPNVGPGVGRHARGIQQ